MKICQYQYHFQYQYLCYTFSIQTYTLTLNPATCPRYDRALAETLVSNELLALALPSDRALTPNTLSSTGRSSSPFPPGRALTPNILSQAVRSPPSLEDTFTTAPSGGALAFT